jgi:hypothetical protein
LRVHRAALALALLALPGLGIAHGFGRLYTLPVPLWLYAWGAGSALVVSFLLAAFFLNAPAPGAERPPRDLSDGIFGKMLRRLLPALRLLSLALLLLCIATALVGNRDPYRNFSMPFFWVWFTLGFTYLIALTGDFYGPLNPWRVLVTALQRVWPAYGRGRWTYPAHWGERPALLLYLGFIAIELFGHGRPRALGEMLLVYTLINLLGVGLIGARDWFRYGECFAVFFRLVGRMGVFAVEAGRLLARPPLSGLRAGRPTSLSTVLFVLAMLASTAFDGLRATQTWVQLFWGDVTGLISALTELRPMQDIARFRSWYLAWESFSLVALPLVYFAAYALALWLGRWLTRSPRPLRELMLAFGYSLLPIAWVYHLTHYATLLLSEGLKVLALISDPFGWGWNLFGTAWRFRAPILPPVEWVWHSQVGMILLGHVLSVIVAHRIALRVFPTRAQALLSQLPMLMLMVGFTVAGLWILSQPLTTERLM